MKTFAPVRIMGKYQLGVLFSEEELEQIVEFLKSLDGQIIQFDKWGYDGSR